MSYLGAAVLPTTKTKAASVSASNYFGAGVTLSSGNNAWNGGHAPGGVIMPPPKKPVSGAPGGISTYKPPVTRPPIIPVKPKVPASKPPVVQVKPIMPVLKPLPPVDKPAPLKPMVQPTVPSPVAPESAVSTGASGGGGGASGGTALIPSGGDGTSAPIIAEESDSMVAPAISPVMLGLGALAVYFLFLRRR